MPTAVVMAVAAVAASRAAKSAQAKALKAQQQGQSTALGAVKAGAKAARRDAIPLFESGLENRLQGFQGALDVFAQTIPGQIDAFQGGNLRAQNTLLAGLDPQIAAILGGNIDLSGLQARQTQTPDFSLFQQELPQFQSISDVLSGAAAPPPRPDLTGGIMPGLHTNRPNTAQSVTADNFILNQNAPPVSVMAKPQIMPQIMTRPLV